MDSMTKEQLRWALLDKGIPIHGTKADLEHRLLQRLELEGKDAAEFYLEVQANGTITVSLLYSILSKEMTKMTREMTEHHNKQMMSECNKQMTELQTKMSELLTERTELLIEREKFLKEQYKQMT